MSCAAGKSHDHLRRSWGRRRLHARIVSVCDAYDSLINDRPYRSRRSPEEAMAILSSGAGAQWDPKVVSLLASQIGSA